jgi:hypothetical protein
MYEGYINNQKKIDAAIEADPNANLSSFNGQMMMATTTSAYRLRAGQTSKNEETGVITKIPPVWEHVVLTDATIGTKKVKTWVPVAGENVIPAQGAWSKMKAATKQYRTKN